MAPEGTRSKTHTLSRGKTGAAYLAHEAGVPLVPVGIYGTERAWASWLRLRRPVFTMVIGAPFRLPPIDPQQRQSRLRADTDEIMCRIAALIPVQYHGYYANHPHLKSLSTSMEG
jgi:1-acyl-sn-glycerol-3-phosphate acyltransferase